MGGVLSEGRFVGLVNVWEVVEVEESRRDARSGDHTIVIRAELRTLLVVDPHVDGNVIRALTVGR